MFRVLVRMSLASLVLVAAGCSGYGNASPTTPTGSSGPPEGAIVINVLGIDGNRSFSPNPATVPVGQTVVWHNVDTTTHRVVLDNGLLDTGNIAPGAFSAPMKLSAAGPYHCTIHPPMVGAIAR